ncbi:hypothetical protein [Devosia sp. 63-57]|uniref:hypothetical protein n=1 Tax=Devosia sp. 63-57 TaxID=1895751 RepID=UPI00086F1983|nr:hypothetical protein [Devosia sp. 63-57]ODT47062.1 MAG: hypothetical protein ABS74_12155 [Pelagibacterium sp. SCN 63-126]ODU88877.1 MAG: hypothetical protein ABT14_01025 [Pelagibacterium sp. SCN 63-17]OJX43228.1 MAG: hypothetical protein BGO80_17720 [Devosia sp. 63-57]
MTAVNVFRMHDRIVMHSDAAAYTDGAPPIFVGEVTKTFTFPGKRMAVAVRGPSPSVAHIAATFGDAFADIGAARKGNRFFRSMVPALLDYCRMTTPSQPHFQAFLAGWSDGKADSFMVTSEQSPYHLMDLPEIAGAPVPSIDPGIDPADFRPERDGLRLMEAQRKSGFSLGGHVLATTIWADMIEQAVIHRWGDTPGLPLNAIANDA